MDTIFALASARGKAGVAVVRISGPAAHAAVAQLAGDVPPARNACLRRLRAGDGTPLDSALVLTFANGASFTGEASAELHLHGSRATTLAVLSALSSVEGLRHAEPGEFTRRALDNGRMDLTEVEGLADLIDAETEAQRKQALRVLSGAVGAAVDGWRSHLVRAMALLAATIDFADEEVPESLSDEVAAELRPVRDGIAAEVAGAAAAERLREGFEVAIIGPPNIGKSTLLNALAGREAAITSDIAGTTRDVIEVRMDIRGLPVTVLDTAGLRDTDDAVETLGIDRALARAAGADLRVFLTDGKAPQAPAPQNDDIVLLAKSDLRADRTGGVSGLTGQGVGALLDRVAAILEDRASGASLVTHVRHRQAAVRALAHLDTAMDALETDVDRSEIIAEELRGAAHALDAWMGRVDIETVLDEVFKSFCLGK